MASADRRRRAQASLIFALCVVVTVAYGALYYGFAVLITDKAAEAEFSRTVLSVAYGGAVVTSGLAAVPVGRIADRVGVRAIIAVGTIVGAAGLLGFAAATRDWQVLAVWWLLLGPAIAMTFYEPAYVAIQHAFGPQSRARAIGILTLTAGLSGADLHTRDRRARRRARLARHHAPVRRRARRLRRTGRAADPRQTTAPRGRGATRRTRLDGPAHAPVRRPAHRRRRHLPR